MTVEHTADNTDLLSGMKGFVFVLLQWTFQGSYHGKENYFLHSRFHVCHNCWQKMVFFAP